MFKIIPGNKDIGAQISCNLKKINKNILQIKINQRKMEEILFS